MLCSAHPLRSLGWLQCSDGSGGRLTFEHDATAEANSSNEREAAGPRGEEQQHVVASAASFDSSSPSKPLPVLHA